MTDIDFQNLPATNERLREQGKQIRALPTNGKGEVLRFPTRKHSTSICPTEPTPPEAA